MKDRILFFIKTPPPVTGVTVINEIVSKSKLLDSAFEIRKIEISYVTNVSDFGYINLDKIIQIIGYYFRLFFELITKRPKIVYFQISPLGFAFIRDSFFVLLIKVLRVPIVFHIHGKGIKQEMRRKGLVKYVYKLVFKKEFVITLSNMLVFDFDEIGLDNKPKIVPNGIKHINPTSYIKPTNSNKVNILFFSNLFESKGLIDYLDALKILNTNEVQFFAHIAGDEGDISQDELRKFIQNRNLTHSVIYHGPLYNEAKEKLFNQMDIFVHPTLNDVWGLVIIEAMSASLPVIATIEGAIPEIVEDNKTGFLVKKNEPSQLAKRIEYLIKNKKTRESFGKASRKKYEETYTIDHFEENMVQTFTEILADLESK